MRQSLIVSHDLRGHDETSTEYAALIEAIKAYGTWGKLTLSTWIIVTEDSAESVRDHLASFMDSDDRLFVCPLARGAAWRNLIASSDWVKDRP